MISSVHVFFSKQSQISKVFVKERGVRGERTSSSNNDRHPVQEEVKKPGLCTSYLSKKRKENTD